MNLPTLAPGNNTKENKMKPTRENPIEMWVWDTKKENGCVRSVIEIKEDGRCLAICGKSGEPNIPWKNCAPIEEESTDYDMINPPHYNQGSIETIEKMRRIWGNEATAIHCEMCAFKYRERIGSKPGNSVEQELEKIKWYERKTKELRKLKENKKS